MIGIDHQGYRSVAQGALYFLHYGDVVGDAKAQLYLHGGEASLPVSERFLA